MKLVKVAIASSLLAFVMTVSAQAQNLRASIPFKFSAGNQVLPAGDYTIKMDRVHQRIEVSNLEGTVQSYIPLMAAQTFNSNGKAVLVFNTYGRAHFLKIVKPSGNGEGWSLFESRAEREVAKNVVKSTTEVAVVR